MRQCKQGPDMGKCRPRASRKVPPPQSKIALQGRVEKCRPPKPRVKANSSFSGGNYFITMHRQAGVNFDNVTEVKFRVLLLTGTGHRDRRLNRESPGQTGTYGRSNLDQNLKPKLKFNFRFIRDRPFAIHSFHQKCRPSKNAAPGYCPTRPPCQGPECKSTKLLTEPILFQLLVEPDQSSMV